MRGRPPKKVVGGGAGKETIKTGNRKKKTPEPELEEILPRRQTRSRGSSPKHDVTRQKSSRTTKNNEANKVSKDNKEIAEDEVRTSRSVRSQRNVPEEEHAETEDHPRAAVGAAERQIRRSGRNRNEALPFTSVESQVELYNQITQVNSRKRSRKARNGKRKSDEQKQWSDNESDDDVAYTVRASRRKPLRKKTINRRRKRQLSDDESDSDIAEMVLESRRDRSLRGKKVGQCTARSGSEVEASVSQNQGGDKDTARDDEHTNGASSYTKVKEVEKNGGPNTESSLDKRCTRRSVRNSNKTGEDVKTVETDELSEHIHTRNKKSSNKRKAETADVVGAELDCGDATKELDVISKSKVCKRSAPAKSDSVTGAKSEENVVNDLMKLPVKKRWHAKNEKIETKCSQENNKDKYDEKTETELPNDTSQGGDVKKKEEQCAEVVSKAGAVDRLVDPPVDPSNDPVLKDVWIDSTVTPEENNNRSKVCKGDKMESGKSGDVVKCLKEEIMDVESEDVKSGAKNKRGTRGSVGRRKKGKVTRRTITPEDLPEVLSIEGSKDGSVVELPAEQASPLSLIGKVLEKDKSDTGNDDMGTAADHVNDEVDMQPTTKKSVEKGEDQDIETETKDLAVTGKEKEEINTDQEKGDVERSKVCGNQGESIDKKIVIVKDDSKALDISSQDESIDENDARRTPTRDDDCESEREAVIKEIQEKVENLKSPLSEVENRKTTSRTEDSRKNIPDKKSVQEITSLDNALENSKGMVGSDEIEGDIFPLSQESLMDAMKDVPLDLKEEEELKVTMEKKYIRAAGEEIGCVSVVNSSTYSVISIDEQRRNDIDSDLDMDHRGGVHDISHDLDKGRSGDVHDNVSDLDKGRQGGVHDNVSDLTCHESISSSIDDEHEQTLIRSSSVEEVTIIGDDSLPNAKARQGPVPESDCRVVIKEGADVVENVGSVPQEEQQRQKYNSIQSCDVTSTVRSRDEPIETVQPIEVVVSIHATSSRGRKRRRKERTTASAMAKKKLVSPESQHATIVEILSESAEIETGDVKDSVWTVCDSDNTRDDVTCDSEKDATAAVVSRKELECDIVKGPSASVESQKKVNVQKGSTSSAESPKKASDKDNKTGSSANVVLSPVHPAANVPAAAGIVTSDVPVTGSDNPGVIEQTAENTVHDTQKDGKASSSPKDKKTVKGRRQRKTRKEVEESRIQQTSVISPAVGTEFMMHTEGSVARELEAIPGVDELLEPPQLCGPFIDIPDRGMVNDVMEISQEFENNVMKRPVQTVALQDRERIASPVYSDEPTYHTMQPMSPSLMRPVLSMSECRIDTGTKMKGKDSSGSKRGRKKVEKKKESIESSSLLPGCSDVNVVGRQPAHSNKFLGAHCSMTGGPLKAVKWASECDALYSFGMYLRTNTRPWTAKPLTDDDANKFKEKLQASGISPSMVLPHGPNAINCGAAADDLLKRSRECLLDDMQRCERMGLPMYNFHPGTVTWKLSKETCIQKIADSINFAHANTSTVITVLENTCGSARSVGGEFQELRDIMDRVIDKARMGVCINVCHAFAAGYDLSCRSGYDRMMTDMEQIVGLQYLKAVIISDSKGECGDNQDRHEDIGKGHMGAEPFHWLMNDPRLDHLPMILDVPDRDCSEAIGLLYGMIK